MHYCLHGSIICPSAQMVYTKADSYIRCGDIEIPILSAHNTKDGIPRALAPNTCPLNKVEPAPKTKEQHIEPSVLTKWGRKKKHNRKFTDEQILDIRKRFANGEPQRSIADCYGVTQMSISAICTGRIYRDVV